VNLRGRIPVEPLDEERVVNIERAVVRGYADAVARPHRAPLRWFVPALCGAAVAAAVAAIAVVKLRPVREVAAPAVAAAPMRVETTDAGSRLELGDATIDAAPGTAVVVTRPDCGMAWSSAVEACPVGTSGVLVTLDGGKVELAVASRAGRAPLVVRAGDVDVVVVGTRFSVERADAITVRVTEGVVRVARAGAEVRVAAGQSWSAATQIAAGEAMPEPTTTVAAAPPGDVIATDDFELTTEDADVPGLRDRDAAVPTASKVERDRGPKRTQRTPPDAGSGSGSSAGGGSGSATPTLLVQVQREDVERPFAVGVTGADAIGSYTALLSGNADEKRRAFYGLAYTSAALGKRAEALRWVKAYVTQAPRGAELESVLWLRIQLLCHGGIGDDCRKAAAFYVDRFPSSTRGELAVRLANSL
jgi:hypothetical protein